MVDKRTLSRNVSFGITAPIQGPNNYQGQKKPSRNAKKNKIKQPKIPSGGLYITDYVKREHKIDTISQSSVI